MLDGGPGSDHSIYRPAYSALADIAQIVYLDHRGNGRSEDGPRESWKLAQWGDDVAGFCDALGIVSPIVLGASFGGPEVGALARRRFLEAQGHPDQASLDAWARLALPHYTRVPRHPDMARRAVNRSEVLRWFTKPGGESHTFNMFGDLERIRCPTLVLGGEDDPIHPIESQADIAAALPSHLVQFERFPDCGHAVVTDAPERAMAVIRDFIARH